VLSHALYPKVFEDFKAFQSEFGDVSVLDTRSFLVGMQVGQEIEVSLEDGKTLVILLVSVSPPDPISGMVTVFFELNGAPRQVQVHDDSLATSQSLRSKADSSVEGSIGAPMPGVVVNVSVRKGDAVEPGSPLVTLNGMKMEMTVVSPVKGIVTMVEVETGHEVEAGDLLVEVRQLGVSQDA